MNKKMFVFDLDFTLWDAGGTWCDCTTPPFKFIRHKLFDANGALIRLYPDVIDILTTLKSNHHQIAVASRTSSPPIAKQLLKLFDLNRFIDFMEIYPGSKITHFSELVKKSNCAYNQMVFFDDEFRNIQDIKPLGVECFHVKNGITKEIINPYV